MGAVVCSADVRGSIPNGSFFTSFFLHKESPWLESRYRSPNITLKEPALIT